MAQDEDGVISIKGGDTETMRMIANKRLQEIHSLFHYAYRFFPPLPLATQDKVGKQIMASFSYDGRFRRSYY
jgi:hypothetical protein